MADSTRGALALLIEAVRPLMDSDFCQPYHSAWEFDPYSNRGRVTLDGGEEIHAQLRAAFEIAEKAQ